MRFYNTAKCYFTKSHHFYKIPNFQLRIISNHTRVVRAPTRHDTKNDGVVFHKIPIRWNYFNRFYSSNDIKPEERIGICEKLVKSSGALRPFLKLIRFDKPAGSLLLFWPFGWSIALAANPAYLPDLRCLSTFFIMAVILRGVGCTLNDMWDKNIDQKVARTKSRPLAAEELTRFDAFVFLAGQLGLVLLILQRYNLYTVILTISSLTLAISYPLMKRITPYPQVVLGMAMNYGALLGSPAVNGFSDWSICLPLYLGGICWTVVYDTIYAYQDITDDKKLGLKSTAITFNDHPKLWLSGFGFGMISLMSVCGVTNEQTWPFYTSLGLISIHLINQIYTLNPNDPQDCASKFSSNQQIGIILFLGIVLGNLLKSKSIKDESSRPSDQISVIKS